MLKRSALLLVIMTAVTIIAGCTPGGGSQQNQQPASAQTTYWTPGERLTQANGLYYFASLRRGWKLVVGGSSAGSKEVDLYGTADGGQKWVKLGSSAKANLGEEDGGLPKTLPTGTIPFVETKNGVTFLNESTGWMAGTTGTGGVDWLYVSHDGGRTWRHQNIEFPAIYSSSQAYITPPAFFTDKDGILPVAFARHNDYYHYIYFTHDGGQSWGDEVLASGMGSFGPLQWRFTDSKTGFITISRITWESSDGGYTWTKKPSSGRNGTVAPVSSQITPVNRPLVLGDQIIPIGYKVGESIIYPSYGMYNIYDNPDITWTKKAKVAYVKNRQGQKDLAAFRNSPYANSPEAQQFLVSKK